MGIKLNPIDYLGYITNTFDSEYIYLNQGGSKLYRSGPENTPVEVFDFVVYGVNKTILSAFAATNNSLLVVIGDNVTFKSHLYLSEDQGETFSGPVLLFGDVDGTEANQIQYVETLQDRSFCYDTFNKKILVGEYNYNPSRTPGGLNDQVRLMSSADLGATWSEVAHWNTDGANTNFRHIHAVRQDPYTGTIYVCAGEDAAGIFAWDGVSAITSNADFDTYTTPYLWGQGKYRHTDLLFTKDWIFGFADTLSAGNRGIWRFAKDLSSELLVDDSVTANTNHTGYFGLKTSNGGLIFTEFLETGHTDGQIYFYTSNDSGASWEVTAKFGCQVSTKVSSRGLFEFNGMLYFSSNGAGKDYHNTTILTQSVLKGNAAADIIHPVYWVSPGGVDTTTPPRGYRPREAWANLHYGLISNRITNGARVIVSDGVYPTLAAPTISFSSHIRPGNPLMETIIDGSSYSSVHIYLEADSVATSLLTVGKDETPIKFRGIRFSSRRNTGYIANILDHTTTRKDIVTFEKCCIGDSKYAITRNIYNGEGVFLDRCVLEADATTDHIHTTVAVESSVVAHYCLFKGGQIASYCNKAATPLTFLNCTFVGHALRGIHTVAGMTVVPVVKNCVFAPLTTSVFDLIDGASLIETDSEIDYNVYGGLQSAIANSGGSHSVTASPLFNNTLEEDYKIRKASPCKGAGVDVGITTADIIGNALNTPVDIGAYAYIVLNVIPNSGITIGVGTGI